MNPSQIELRRTDLSTRAWNVVTDRLRAGEYHYGFRYGNTRPRSAPIILGEVAALTVKDWLETKNCGRATVNELRDVLTNAGLAFAVDPPPHDGPRCRACRQVLVSTWAKEHAPRWDREAP